MTQISELEYAREVRAALLMQVRAIEKRFPELATPKEYQRKAIDTDKDPVYNTDNCGVAQRKRESFINSR